MDKLVNELMQRSADVETAFAELQEAKAAFKEAPGLAAWEAWDLAREAYEEKKQQAREAAARKEEADRKACEAEASKPWWEQTFCSVPTSFDFPRRLNEAVCPEEAALEKQECANAWAAFQKQGQPSKNASSSADSVAAAGPGLDCLTSVHLPKARHDDGTDEDGDDDDDGHSHHQRRHH